MSSKAKEAPKKECPGFESQTWRRSMCKHCFRTKSQHNSSEGSHSPSSSRSTDQKLVEKVKNGDKNVDDSSKNSSLNSRQDKTAIDTGTNDVNTKRDSNGAGGGVGSGGARNKARGTGTRTANGSPGQSPSRRALGSMRPTSPASNKVGRRRDDISDTSGDDKRSNKSSAQMTSAPGNVKSSVLYSSQGKSEQQDGVSKKVRRENSMERRAARKAETMSPRTQLKLGSETPSAGNNGAKALSKDDKQSSKNDKGSKKSVRDLERELSQVEDKYASLEQDYMDLDDDLMAKEERFEEINLRNEKAISDLQDQLRTLDRENCTLRDKIMESSLPESERTKSGDSQEEDKNAVIQELEDNMDELQKICDELREENQCIKEEMFEMQQEMEEMQDQFREEETLEFRELQKELEMTSKNVRILQFKLRKAERLREQTEVDKMAYEDKLRQLQSTGASATSDNEHIAELEEELKMAQEVSVRLHDELEMVEERRCKVEEDNEIIQQQLRASENRCVLFESEVDMLRSELIKLRSEAFTSMERPTPDGASSPSSPAQTSQQTTFSDKKLRLTRTGSAQSSYEYDAQQLMRDLSDSMEREQDVKEQLKYAEEETKIMRRKLSDLEEENEGLSLQLKKVAVARSTRFRETGGKKSSLGLDEDPEVLTEKELEFKLQMELAEQEASMLRRKISDMQLECDNLQSEVKFLQQRLKSTSSDSMSSPFPDSYYDGKIRLLTEEVDSLRWKIIEKNREIERLSEVARSHMQAKSNRPKLQKSHSLDSEQQLDMQRQIDSYQKEELKLRSLLAQLESENERLISRNRKLEQVSSRQVGSGTSIEAMQSDDDAVLTMELKQRLRSLQDENTRLKERCKDLSDRSQTVTMECSKAQGSLSDSIVQSKDLQEQLRLHEHDTSILRKKVADLESENSKLSRELLNYKSKRKVDSKKSKIQFDKLGVRELREKAKEMEEEISDLFIIVKSREEDNVDLEDQVRHFRDELELMKDGFRKREKELLEELDQLDSKQSVTANMLELVNDRFDVAQRELERLTAEKTNTVTSMTFTRSSPPGGVSSVSDDVFSSETTGDPATVLREWEEHFMKRITSLERLLAEERQRSRAAEKRMELRDSPRSDIRDDISLLYREKELLSDEVLLCHTRLDEVNEQNQSLQHELSKQVGDQDSLKQELESVKNDLDNERSKSKEKAESTLAGSQAWQREKQELNQKLEDYKANVEALNAQLQKAQHKWKSGYERTQAETRTKELLEKESRQLKEDCSKHKHEVEDLKLKLKEEKDTWASKEKQWKDEKSRLSENQQSYKTKIEQLELSIKSKDTMVKEKEELLRKNLDILKEKDSIVDEKNKIIKENEHLLKQRENETRRSADQLKEKDSMLKLKTDEMKTLKDTIRSRDDKLREKEDHNTKIMEKLRKEESKVIIMDNTLKETIERLNHKENDIRTLQDHIEVKNQELKSMHERFSAYEKTNKDSSQKLQKEIELLKSDKVRLESNVQQLQEQRETARSELASVNESLKAKEKKFEREKSNKDNMIKQLEEKVRSTELYTKFRQSQAIETLSKEKRDLMDEKHKLEEDLRKLGDEMKESNKNWNNERNELKKVIEDKTKLVEDNMSIIKMLQKDIEKLKSSISKNNDALAAASKGSDVTKEQMRLAEQRWHKEKKDLLDRVIREEKLLKAETKAIQLKYASKMRTLEQEIEILEGETTSLRKQNDTQRDQLRTAQRNFDEIKTKHDTQTDNWEREHRRVISATKEMEEKKRSVKELEKKIQELQELVSREERQRKEVDNKLTTEKTAWEIQRVNMQDKIDQLEEQLKNQKGTVPKRVRFESREEKEHTEIKKLLDKSHSHAVDLEKQLQKSERSRELDKREILGKLESKERQWENERKKMMDKNAEVEEKVRQITSLQKKLESAQNNVKSERMEWERERKELRQSIDNSKKVQQSDKRKIDDLILELQKLKTITPVIEEMTKSEHYSTSQASPSKSRPGLSLYIPPRDRNNREEMELAKTLDDRLASRVGQALNQIERVTDDLSDYKQKLENGEPLPLRRTLSSSELDMSNQALYQQTPPTDISTLISDTERTSFEVEEIPSSYGLTSSRPIRSRPTSRYGAYTSGTQSATGSRTGSPDRKRGPLSPVKKVTNYPDPPRGFLIRPSGSRSGSVPSTPTRYEEIKDRYQADVLTSENVSHLYDKLKHEQIQYFTKDRPMLQKSASLDERGDESPVIPGSTIMDHSPTPSGGSDTSKPRVQKRYGRSKTDTLTVEHSDHQKSSPRSQRQVFYDDYNKSDWFMSLPDRRGSKSKRERTSVKDIDYMKPDDSDRQSEDSAKGAMGQSTSETSIKSSKDEKESKSSVFGLSVRARRKLFQKSSSLENSNTEKSIGQAGLSLVAPAAPSTSQEPTPVVPSEPEPKTKKKPYRRSFSLDIAKLIPGRRNRSRSRDRSKDRGSKPDLSREAKPSPKPSPTTPSQTLLSPSSSSTTPSVTRESSESSISSRLSRATSATSPRDGEFESRMRGLQIPTMVTPSMQQHSPTTRRSPQRWRHPSMEKSTPIVTPTSLRRSYADPLRRSFDDRLYPVARERKFSETPV
ncbi:unnamed protein product [Owenia fusiformis]|uniref:Uncharacterized protein n=1 Tax=Owenia fusiformis TaxID=6347 RepID=A0A8J1UE79_OWEFU|nr:unnamed protein product [Owenia fusiformis]